MDDPLTPADLVARLRAVQDEAQAHAAELTAALRGVAWGADPTGAVRAAVDGEGAVVAIELTQRWQSLGTARGLESAVVAAVGAAGQALMTTGTEPAPPAMTLHADAEPRDGRPAMPRSPEAAMRWLTQLVTEVGSSLGEVRDVATRAAAEPVEGRGPSGRVTATGRSGVVERIEFDERWLRVATREKVQSELTQALRIALPGHRRHVRASVRSTGRAGELLDLTADPVRLLAELGLGRSGRAS
jgi:hypothetical protein